MCISTASVKLVGYLQGTSFDSMRKSVGEPPDHKFDSGISFKRWEEEHRSSLAIAHYHELGPLHYLTGRIHHRLSTSLSGLIFKSLFGRQ